MGAEKLAFKKYNYPILQNNNSMSKMASKQPKPVRFQILENQRHLNSALINDEVDEVFEERNGNRRNN